ncbi:hypothetical protein [Desulfovibrio sp.]|uniref:hypothetical protein n=1 Tax=Desulfovibrio sp. TaxID=885 RepID=UPI0023CF5F5B|nr:hypothetical protein [Desulfovibrio sp.]MDE7241358.1 hypothetical protein [Desulfovibrio sp.]
MLTGMQIGFLLGMAALSALAHLCLKQGARMCGKGLMSVAFQPWIWLGIGLMALSVLTYAWILRQTPLTVAMPFAALVYVLVPVGARYFFAETLLPRFWAGVLLIGCGVVLTAL